MKLRGSWGLVGNDQINGSRFIYMSQIDLGGKGFTTGVNQNVTYNGPVYQRYANEDITWEVGEKINFGVDLQLFHSLDLTFDIFREIVATSSRRKGPLRHIWVQLPLKYTATWQLCAIRDLN